MATKLIQNSISNSVSEDKFLVASTGRYYAVYADGSNLIVAYSDDGGVSWTEVTVAKPSGLSILAAVIDSQDKIHIVYNRATYIVSYRSFSGGAFGSQEDIYDGSAASDDVWMVNIAVNSSDIPHVVWAQQIANADAYPFYSNRSGGSWAARTQLDTSSMTGGSANDQRNGIEIVIDSNNYIWVFWCRQIGAANNAFLHYNKYTSSWLGVGTLLNDSGGGINWANAVVDASDNVHVVVQYQTNVYYFKYTFGTDTWSAGADISDVAIKSVSSGKGASPSIGRDTAGNLYVIFINDGNDVSLTTSANGGSSWSASSEILDEASSVSVINFGTMRYPVIESKSTQIPSANYYFLYDAGALKVFLHDSLTLQTPLDENYSRKAAAALPSDDANLSTLFGATGYTNVDTENSVFEDQAATDQYAIFLFKNRGASISDNINVSWIGKSTIAPSTSAAVLQIYNRTSGLWETLATNNTAAANTPFTLTGSKVSSLSSYYDGSLWVSCRVYQLAQ